MIENRNGEPYVENVPLRRILDCYGTPILIYSRRRIAENVGRLTSSFARHKCNTTLHFSLKACTFAPALRAIREEGMACEVGSDFEYGLARAVGWPAHAIVWNSVCKSNAELEIALAEPMRIWHLDALQEAFNLNERLSLLGTAQAVAVRVVPDLPSEYIGAGSKLGHPIGSGQALAACKVVAGLSHLRLVGLHCHFTVCESDPTLFARMAEAIVSFAQTVGSACGIGVSYLNLGGGLKALSVLDEKHGLLDAVVDGLMHQLDGFAGEVAVEPGRVVVADTAVAVGTLLAKKVSGNRAWWITDLNTSVLLPFNNCNYKVSTVNPDDSRPLVTVGLGDRMSTYSGTIVPSASIRDGDVGDLIAVTECGAYTYSARQAFIYPEHLAVLVDGDRLTTD